MAIAALMAKAAAAIPLSLFFKFHPLHDLIYVLNFQHCALISNCLLIRKSKELTMQGEM